MHLPGWPQLTFLLGVEGAVGRRVAVLNLGDLGGILYSEQEED